MLIGVGEYGSLEMTSPVLVLDMTEYLSEHVASSESRVHLGEICQKHDTLRNGRGRGSVGPAMGGARVLPLEEVDSCAVRHRWGHLQLRNPDR